MLEKKKEEWKNQIFMLRPIEQQNGETEQECKFQTSVDYGAARVLAHIWGA